MIKINWSDFTDFESMKSLCQKEKVILDFNLWDIPNTMRRNIKAFAEIGAYAMTVSNHPWNAKEISQVKAWGKEYGIKIIQKNIPNEVI